MSPRINHTPPLAQLDLSQTIEGAPRVEFTFPLPTKTPTPEQFADAALAALGFNDGDLQAYDAHSGGSLRQRLAAGFVEQGGAATSVVTDEQHRQGAGRFHLSRQNYEGLQRFLAERRQASAPPATASSASETFSMRHGYNIAEQQRAALEARLAEQQRSAPRPSEPPSPPPPADSRQEGSQEGVGAFLDGVVRGDFSSNESWSATAGQIIGGLNPLADARDIAAGIYHVAQGKEGAWFELGTAAAGAIPLGGDAAKALLRSGRKVVTELGEEVAERTIREGAGETAQQGGKRAADAAVSPSSAPPSTAPSATLPSTGANAGTPPRARLERGDGAFALEDTLPYVPSNKVFGQLQGGSCVAANCRMLLNDPDIPEAYIRDAAKVDYMRGASIKNIPDALQAFGRSGYRYAENLSIDELQSAVARGPAVVSVSTDATNGAHALVVDGIEDGYVLIRDSLPESRGTAYKVLLEDFKAAWSGRAVVLEP